MFILSGCFQSNVAFGQSCGQPPCAPNPIPCAHCIGTWTDNGAAVWTVTSLGNPVSPGTQTVTGHVVVPNPVGCPNSTYSVSGSLTQTTGNGYTIGTTAITWIASNPNPSGMCGGYTPVPSNTYTGSITNNGCDNASGTWLNSSGLKGTFTMTKPSDLATNETSTAIAWWSVYPTVLLFQGNISSQNSLAGRQVFESPNGSPTDTCYRTSDAVMGYRPYQLQGGGWYVGYYFFNSTYQYDYVGFSTTVINYYRSQRRPPCLAMAPQAMNIYTQGGVGSARYYTDTLILNLPDYVNVGVARGGVQGWRTW